MDFREFLNQGFVILDGATGSNLQEAGMKSGDCPELWITQHPDIFIDLQKRYIEAGSDVLYTPTFTSTSIKLAEYGLEERQEELVHSLVGLTKEAVRLSGTERKIYILGDISKTGFLSGGGRSGRLCHRDNDEPAGVPCGSSCRERDL